MRVLTIDNKYNDGDQSHFFMRQGEKWGSMFKPELTLRQFLEDLLKLVEWGEEGSQFDLPEGGGEALKRAATRADADGFFSMLARWDQKADMLTEFGDWEVGWEDLDAHHLRPRELATILAALRMYQGKVMTCSVADDLVDIATDGGSFDALSDEEIDELCEKLN